LPGIRLGVLADAPEGQLNMKMLKELTTGEPVAAKVKFKKDFTLESVCKLAVGTNHRLRLKNTGMDAQRRVRMVPFDWTVPDSEVVPTSVLKQQLLEEAPQILALLIYYAGEYYRKGGGARAFPPCAIVDEASREYLESQDLVGRWLEDNTEAAPGEAANFGDLFRDFVAWCKEQNIQKIMEKNTFGNHLTVHIKEKKHTNKGTAYIGIKLIGASPPLPGSGSG